MAIEPDSSPYGSQTVTGPGWPNVDEEALAAAAATYEQLAAKITGTVVPQQQSQLHTERYGYRPQEHTVQQQYQRRGSGAVPAPQVQQAPQRTESAPANPTARVERHEESRGDGRRDGGGRDRR